MFDLEVLKRRVAEEAVKEVVDGDLIGLGGGSTVAHFIKALGLRVRDEGLRVEAVPASYQTHLMALDNGIRSTSLDEHVRLSKSFDGADKVDLKLNALKGGGGCQTREKVVAAASDRLIILIDHSKLVDEISGDYPIPIEVIPFAYGYVARRLKEMGGRPRLREGRGKLGPVISDDGNFIIDVAFPGERDVKSLGSKLKSIPGVVEHGIFADMVDKVYVGYPEEVKILERKGRRSDDSSFDKGVL